MNTGKTEEEAQGLTDNDLFTFDPDKLEIEEDEDLKDFRSDDSDQEEAEQEEEAEEGEEEEDEENLFEEEAEEEAEEEFTDADLASFNKKLNKDFKSAEELKNFLDQGDSKETASADDQEYDKADSSLKYYEPILRLNDEDLMRKQYESIAIQEGKDLNNEDVQIEIEDKVQDLIDSRTISLHAKDLRRDIQSQVINPALAKKQEIEGKRSAAQAAQAQSEKQALQDAFASIHNTGNFFGLKTDMKRIQKAYKDANSGELINKIKSDKKLAAEVATLLEYKEELYKKASGRTYSEGVAAVLDDYKSKKESSGTSIAKAQRRGQSGGSDAVKDLKQGLLS